MRISDFGFRISDFGRRWSLLVALLLMVAAAAVPPVARPAHAAPTVTFAGTVTGGLSGVNTLSGGETGSSTFATSFTRAISTGATAPDVVGGGGYQGTFTCTTGGGLLNLADSTNICKTNATGTIAPSQGYVITAVKKLRALYLQNNDTANTVTVSIPATLGLAGLTWSANATVVVLQPNACVLYIFPSGSSTLTAGSNDGISFTSSAGTPTVNICAVFG